MDISKLKHDPDKVNKTLFVTDSNELRTATGCKIYIPAGYIGKGLASISSEVSTLGVFAIFCDDVHYGVSMATSMVVLGPCDFDTVSMGDEDFYVFTFDKGAVVIEDVNLVKNKKITSPILDYFNDYGHSPWFMNGLLQSELLRDTKYFNDIFLGGGQPVYDMMVAPLARDPKNIKTQWRHILKVDSDIFSRPALLPSRDIAANTTSNFARLNGSEMKQGIKAALLSKPEREEPLETIFIK